MSTLVVAAVREELHDLPGEAVGVGVLRAAVATARLLAERAAGGAPVTRVLQVGSCGAFDAALPAPTVIVATEVGLGAPVDLLGKGYTPLPPPALGVDPAAVAAAAALGAVPTRLLTNQSITTDPALVAAFAAHWGAEHMEAAAVAWACREAGVAWVGVFGVANRVGPEAHAEWLRNRVAAERAAVAVAAGLLTGW